MQKISKIIIIIFLIIYIISLLNYIFIIENKTQEANTIQLEYHNNKIYKRKPKTQTKEAKKSFFFYAYISKSY